MANGPQRLNYWDCPGDPRDRCRAIDPDHADPYTARQV